METKKKKEEQLSQWRSTFRGCIWLSTPLPFLFFCCGYFVPRVCTVLRIITTAHFMLTVFVMLYRYDDLKYEMRQRGELRTKAAWKSALTIVILLSLGVALFGIVTNLYVPLYLRGLIASGYYILLAICWYRKIKEPTKE